METAYIYKIVCKDDNIKEFYIGSTFNIQNRIRCHKSTHKNIKSKAYNKKVYKYIRENGMWINFNIVILETFECETTKEKEQKEQEYINKLNPLLNMKKAYQTKEEFLEQSKQTKKKWYENNKQLTIDRAKKYNEINYKKLNEKHICECGGKFTIKHKSVHLKSKKHMNFIS